MTFETLCLLQEISLEERNFEVLFLFCFLFSGLFFYLHWKQTRRGGFTSFVNSDRDIYALVLSLGFEEEKYRSLSGLLSFCNMELLYDWYDLEDGF